MKSENINIKSSCNFVTFVEKRVLGFLFSFFIIFNPSGSSAADFTAKSLGDYNNITVMEVQGNYDSKLIDGMNNSLPRQEVAKEFFKTHKDEYDFLVIFSNFNFQMPESEAKAFYNPVRNDIKGIGIELFDSSFLYGSNSRLQGTIDMGNLSSIVTDPLDPKFEETLYFLSHEMMHRWGANVKFRDASGNLSSSLLGRDGDHWSYLLDTSGSVLYGNRWQDNGNGTFTSLAPHREMKMYGPLDLYLMGMLDKSRVPSMLLIENPAIDPTRLPEAGVTISGAPRQISIGDIIAADGERVPSAALSQKKFKTAFIFITAPGTFSVKEIQEIENIRNGEIARFSILTDGKSIMEIASTPREDVPVNPGIIVQPTAPRTFPPNIEDGISWLVNKQTNDGSWLENTSTTDRDTAEATKVLKNFDAAHENYLKGISWLTDINSENNIDYLARKIEALIPSGNDVTGLITRITALQNADGGWGSERSYSSSPMDTAIVLKSLYLAGYSDQTIISRAINYLKLKQNADGGWGNEDRGSMVQHTANILSAFNSYRKIYSLNDRITSGTAWLIGKQNTDGGFGNSPSTVYDTSTALLSLAEMSASKDITNKALNYILSNQSGDGSWNESPYQTALAIAAVLKAQVDPDLSITSDKVTFIPEKISILPTNVVINADIANLGRTGALAKVALFEGDPSLGKKMGEQTLVFPGQSSTTASFYVEVKDGSEHIYYIVLDPEDLVKESNELNNSAIKILYPESTYDFEIRPSDITVSQNVIDMYQDLKITSKITNKGTMNAYNVQVRYFFDDPASSFEIATVTLDVVPANTTVTNEITWRANKAGANLPVSVQVDPFDSYSELSETNNKASTTLTVNPLSMADPNLSITYRDITITPVPALERGSAHISAVVRNDGYSAADNIIVNFYKGLPGAGGTLIGTQALSSLPADGGATVSIDWTDIRESGERLIYVQVDPENLINEIKEDDNAAFTTLNILGLPDLTLSTGSISLNPPFPKDGDLVSVTVTIQNKGQQDAKDVLIKAYDGSTLIGMSSIPTVPALSQASASFNYDSSARQGIHKLSIIADPDNDIAEQIEENNSAEKEFGIQNADLWVTEQYISPNGDGIKEGTEFFFRLDVPQSVRIIVVSPKGEIVRTFSGGDLENTSGGHIAWNGLNGMGTVVVDGQYQMQVVSKYGDKLGDTFVVVDNNRSPFHEAIGTDFIQDLSVNWDDLSQTAIDPRGWFKDDSGILYWGTGQYGSWDQAGLYKYVPGDKEAQRITPDGWDRLEFSTDFSPVDGRLAVAGYSCYWCGSEQPAKLSLFDDDNDKWTNLDEGAGTYYSLATPRWSPDGKRIAYQKSGALYVINPDGTGKMRIDDDTSRLHYTDDYWGDTWLSYKWSPSGDKIAYATSDSIWVNNLAGDKRKVVDDHFWGIFWSGNDKLISVIYNNNFDNTEIQVVDVNNPSDKKVVHSAGRLDAFFISPDGQKVVVLEKYKAIIAYDVKSDRKIEITESSIKNFDYYYWGAEYSYWYPRPEKLWSQDRSKFYLLGYNQHNNYGDTSFYDVSALVIDFEKLEFKEINISENLNEPIVAVPENNKIAGSWMTDNKTLLLPFMYESGSWARPSYFSMTSIDTGSGMVKKTDIKMDDFYVQYTDDFGTSPLSNYFYYYHPVEEWRPLHIYRSSMNLTSDLKVFKKDSYISVKGTADDLNFDGYKLEYADIKNLNNWNLVQPPSNTPVIDDVLATWVPPYEGTYYVRLTVWDKAGNVLSKQKRVSWGLTSSITNLYKTLSIFSPNGDGIRDSMELKYTVLESVHLEFFIYDQNNNVIRTLVKDHATPGDESISWDGKDGNGIVVPDGKYRIKVLDYEFFVDVDSTPPYVAVSFGPINTKELTASLKGHAEDANFKSWRIDYGEGENPQEWIKLLEGSSSVVKKADNNGNLVDPVIKAFGEQDLGWLGGKKFRIVVEDHAGNTTSATSGFINEVLFISRWDDVRVETEVPASLTRPGIHEIIGFETVGLPVSSLKLQYHSGSTWVDSSAAVNDASGSISISWDTSMLASTVNAVRIKGTDITGREYYSNILTTENIFTLHAECGKPIVGKNYIFEALAELRYQVQIYGESTWRDYQILNGEGIPFGEFFVPLPPSSMTNGTDDFYVEMIATGLSGRTYVSNPVSPTCPVKLGLSVSYKEEDCGPALGHAVLAASIVGKDVTSKVLSYYIQKPEGPQLIRKFDLSSEAQGSVVVDTSDMPEGVYDVKAVLAFVKDGILQEVSVAESLRVDRVLPTALITYPGKSLKICPVMISSMTGDRYFISVEGIATDDRQMKQYELFYGIGENPLEWIPAKNAKGKPIKGDRSVQGALGSWDVTGLKGTDFSIKLRVTDLTGNVSCYTTSFSMDNTTQITGLSSDKTLFSPNGDGIFDEAGINYEIDEYAKVDIRASKLLNGGPDNTPIKTIASGLQHLSGTGVAVWDGRSDSGSTVPDGLYAIVVTIADSCENTNRKWTAVEVENMPPTAIIAYPRPGDPLGNIVEVKGTVDDIHFKSYLLEAGQGVTPDAWTSISSINAPVKDGVLGKWNTFGMEGKWTLRLTAFDAAGNKSVTNVTLDLGTRMNLIKDISAIPPVISPNNDTKLDTADINYELTDVCAVHVEIFDLNNILKRSYTASALTSGIHEFRWDGKDNAGYVVQDGAYTVRMHASLSSNMAVAQDEAITIVVDSTPPVINLPQPLTDSFIKTDITVTGSIADSNLVEYSISYAGPTGMTILDLANQSREGYTFGILDLPDGNYTLAAKAGDIGENIVEKNIAFTVDRTPPKVSLDAPKEGEYYGSDKNNVNIAGVIVEKNLDIYDLRYGLGENPVQWTDLSSGNAVPANSQIFSWKVGKADAVPDGLYTLWLYARDKAGSTGEARVKVTVDNTPPDAVITVPQDGSYVKDIIEVKGTAYDQNLDNYKVDVSEGDCNSAFKWLTVKTGSTSVREGLLASWQGIDGNYCISLSVLDKVGNKAETKVNVKVDTTPPVAPALTGKIDGNTGIRLDWSENAEPELAGYYIYRDGRKINSEPVKGLSYEDQNLGEAVYAYTVTALDLAGWESRPSNEVKLRVDTTGPTVQIRSPQDSSKAGGVVDIRGTANSDDFKQYTVYIGQGQNPESWNLIRTSPLPVSYGSLAQWDTFSLNEGVYSIKLEAEDLLGNISFHKVSVGIDNSPPAKPALTSVTANAGNVSIQWQANTESDLAGYLLFRNDKQIGSLLSGISYLDSSLPDGKFTYYIVARDQAGNMSEQSNSIDVNIDTHPPHATIVEPSGWTRFENKLLVKAESNDSDLAYVQFWYRKAQDDTWIKLGSTASQPFTMYFDPQGLGLPYGEYYIRAEATDIGGKTDPYPSQSYVSYADLTFPAVPSGLRAIVNGSDVTFTWNGNTETGLNGYNIYGGSLLNNSVIKGTIYTTTSLSEGEYTFEITALDNYGNESKPSNAVTARVYSPWITQPPSPTEQKEIQISGSNAELNSSVEIFLDSGSGAASQGITISDGNGNFTFNVTLSKGENSITARVTDSAGNISMTSYPLIVAYSPRPSPPTGLAANVQDHNVALIWNPSEDPDIAGYNVYRNGEGINLPVAVSTGEVSASASDDNNPPSNAFDSNQMTYWSSPYGSGRFNAVWWEIDLPSIQNVKQIGILWGSELYYPTKDPIRELPLPGELPPIEQLYAGSYFEVQVWLESSWVSIGRVSENYIKENIIDFNQAYQTDKIRIYIYGTTDWSESKQVRISEVSISDGAGLISNPSYDDFNLEYGKYTYTVTAVDNYGKESLPSNEAKATIGDGIPPSAPLNLTATASDSHIDLNWTANTEPDLGGYFVYRNTGQGWLKVSQSLATGTTYTDGNLPNGLYTYMITATDTAGNESISSDEASAVVYVAPPQAPSIQSVISIPAGGALNISWIDSYGPSAGYNLYRSSTTGGPYTKANSSLITDNSYIDSGLLNGSKYYYVVTSLDYLGNESNPSEEVMGMPVDTVVPPAPEIFFPTVAGLPIISYTDKAIISGNAEPGANVKLFKDGALLENGRALDKDEINSISFSSNFDKASISPDGKVLAYSYDNGIRLRDLTTGAEKQIIQYGYLPVWSPDAKRFAYYDGLKLAIYDLETGISAPLTGENVYEYDPSWSSDGTKIAFGSYKGGSWNIWLKDMISGSISLITPSGGVYSVISPDGTKLLYFDSYSVIKVINLSDGNMAALGISDAGGFVWSPDSKKIAYASYRSGSNNIYVLDVDTLNETQITSGFDDMYSPAWSPDGKSIAYVKGNSSLLIASLKNPGEERLLQSGLNYSFSNFSWQRYGEIVYTADNMLNRVYPEGYFSFKDISLDAGENIFTARAADSSNNAGPISEAVSVTFDASLIPDLETTQETVIVYPPYPAAGEKAAINVSVMNRGQVEVKDVDVDIYIWDSSGSLQLIKSENIQDMLPNSEIMLSFVWDTSGKTGTNSIIVVVDPYDKITELSELNNYAVRDLFVMDEEGVSMTTILDARQYNSNQDAHIDITLRNSGAVKDITLETRIEDENGYLVKAFDPNQNELSYGQEKTYDLVWNTGSTYAGSYRVHAVLKDSSAIIADEVVPFTITPDIIITSTITTDKLAYGAQENVSLSATLIKSGSNYIVPAVKAILKITDAGGSIMLNEEKDFSNFLPGATVSLNAVWNTGLSLPGDYSAIVEVYVENRMVSSKSQSIKINAVANISGAVTLSQSVVPVGTLAQAKYTLTNAGNTSMSGLTVRILVVDPETRAIMASHEDTINLAANGAWEGQAEFSTGNYGLKTYSIALQSLDQGNPRNLSTASFAVRDVTPPLVIVLNPSSGSMLSSSLQIAASASDDASGVDKVEYQIDNGQWNQVAASDLSTGKYAATWEPTIADTGNHTINVRATDRSGNMSLPVSVSVTVQMVQMDTVAPVSVIAVGEPKHEADGNIFIYGDTVISLSATDDSSGVAWTEYRVDGGVWMNYAPFTIANEGTYLIEYRSQDNAGNPEEIKSFTVIKDTRSPDLTLSTLPDGAYTNKSILNIAGVVTDYVTGVQGLTINDTAMPVGSDGSFSQVITLASGPNTITTIASDTAGNSTKDVRTITLDQAVPVITISTPVDNSVTNDIYATVTGTVDNISTIAVAVNESISSTMTGTEFDAPVMFAYGPNTITVTATDLSGNISVAKRSVTFDDQNPSLSVTYPGEDIQTNQNQITLTGTVSDLTGVIVSVSVDENVYTPTVIDGTFSKVITFTSQKTYRIKVTAVDQAGNQSMVQRNLIYSVYPLNFGIFGASGISISGSSYVDSYNSLVGVYDGAHGLSGSVGTNSTAKGAINLSGGAVIYGNGLVGPGGDPVTSITTNGSSLIHGSKGSLTMAQNLTSVTAPIGGTPTIFQNGTTLTTGAYRVNSINLNGNGTGIISGDVTLYITGSLSLTGGAQIVILPGGSLTVYLDGSLNVTGGAIVNQTLNSHNLTIYGTSICNNATYSGSSALYGVVYTPAAAVIVSGSSIFGTVIGDSIKISGGAAIHYDESLGNFSN